MEKKKLEKKKSFVNHVKFLTQRKTTKKHLYMNFKIKNSIFFDL